MHLSHACIQEEENVGRNRRLHRVGRQRGHVPHVHGVSRPRTPSRRAVPCSPGGVGGGGGAVRYRQTLTAPDTRRGLRPAAGHIHTSPGTIPLCAGSWKWPSVPLSLSATLPTSRTKYMILRFRVEVKTGAHSRGHMYIAGFRFIDLRLGSGHFMGSSAWVLVSGKRHRRVDSRW